MKHFAAGCLTWVMLMTSVAPVQAFYPGMYPGMSYYGPGGCMPGCAPMCMQMQTVQRTVMVPSMTYETRTVPQVVCKPEVRQATCTVMVAVPVQQQVTRQVCIMVPEQRTQTVNYTECKVVMNTVQKQCTVMVPETQTMTGTRRVCSMVPVTMTRTVCEDKGSWQTMPMNCGPSCASPMGCGPAPQTSPAPAGPVSPSDMPQPMTKAKADAAGKIVQVALRRTMQYGSGCCAPTCCTPCQPSVCRVWVPNIVQREVQYTCYKPQVQDVPYQYSVVVCKPVMQTQTVQVPSVVQVPQTRQVTCTVMVPKTENRTLTLTSIKCEPQQRTYSYTVAVPYTVQRQIQVPVCTMVPKVVTCQVPVMVPMQCGPTGCGS